MIFRTGDKVQYRTDNAGRYSGYRFQVRDVADSGDVTIGNSNGLIEIVINAKCLDCIKKVKPPHNRAVYE